MFMFVMVSTNAIRCKHLKLYLLKSKQEHIKITIQQKTTNKQYFQLQHCRGTPWVKINYY